MASHGMMEVSMPRLNLHYNVLNLADVNYDTADSRADTVALAQEARRLHDLGLSIAEIEKRIGKKTKRTKELITGVNQMQYTSIYKIISGLD